MKSNNKSICAVALTGVALLSACVSVDHPEEPSLEQGAAPIEETPVVVAAEGSPIGSPIEQGVDAVPTVRDDRSEVFRQAMLGESKDGSEDQQGATKALEQTSETASAVREASSEIESGAMPVEDLVPASPEEVQSIRSELATSMGRTPIQAANRQFADPKGLAIWNAPDHRRRFIESYLAESETTPTVTEAEREVLIDARDLVAEEKYTEALKKIDKKKEEGSTAVYDYFQANIRYQSGDVEGAIASYQIAVGKFPRYRLAWKNLSQLLVQEARYGEAIKAIIRVLDMGAVDGETYGLLGFCHSSLDTHMSAELAFRMAIMLDPANGEWRMLLARSLFELKKYPEVIDLCEKMLEEQPDSAALWLMQGEALSRSKQPLRAAQNFEVADRLGKSTAGSLLSMADIYAREGLFDMAAARYARALQMDAKASEVRALRGAKYLMAQEANVDAKFLLGELAEHGGEGLDTKSKKSILQMRASLAVQAGDDALEAKILEESLILDPLDGLTLIQLGEYNHRTEDLESAEFYFERASKIEGFEAKARIAHGQALVREGLYQKALPLLKEGLKRQPSDRLQAYVETVERLARR